MVIVVVAVTAIMALPALPPIVPPGAVAVAVAVMIVPVISISRDVGYARSGRVCDQTGGSDSNGIASQRTVSFRDASSGHSRRDG